MKKINAKISPEKNLAKADKVLAKIIGQVVLKERKAHKEQNLKNGPASHLRKASVRQVDGTGRPVHPGREEWQGRFLAVGDVKERVAAGTRLAAVVTG